MICEHCYGKGERGSVEWDGIRVCPECQGSGIVSCCDMAGASEAQYLKPEDYWAEVESVPNDA